MIKMNADEQIAVLRSELTDDPAGKGYSQYLPDAPGMVVEMLNAPTEKMVKAINSTTAQAWAAAGPYAKIVDAGNTIDHPCRSSCLMLRDTLVSGVQIHLEREDVQKMLAAWVTTGVCTKAEAADLNSRGLQPASRAEILGLVRASEEQVRIACQ